MARWLLFLTLLLLPALFPEGGTADDPAAPSPAGVEFFEKKIRPVLVEHCYSCHSETANKTRGGLALDSRAGLERGGDSGPALVRGKPGDSLLIKAVRYTHPDLRMPPKGKLPHEVVADLEKWVALGAPDPRTGKVAVKGGPDSWAARRSWAFRPRRRHLLPAVKDRAWASSAVDRFILARLEALGLRPAPPADRRTLIRRLSFDLIGLPPTPEEIDAFLEDRSPEAYAKVVDRLLASPHYGERWARHWLDIARYADSSGGGRSLLFKDAWRYRDYVIRAFNTDKPYDRFLVEQVAGDLLPGGTTQQRQEWLIATAYLLLGATNYERQDKPVLEMDMIDEQLDTLGKTFLGMTFGCARCHDHKFDAITQKDYYALAGVLKSTKTLVHANVSRWMERPLPLPAERELVFQKHENAARRLKERIRQVRMLAPASNEVPALEAELKRLLAAAPARPMAMAVAEGDKIEDCHLCIRGNFHNPGPTVPRGFPQALTPPGAALAIAAHESGRRQLAAWLASPDNPLTARVMVNRVWHHLFGAGLVRTVDNFGNTGEKPSHPELLDHLAARFTEDGWSVKKLIRMLVLSRTYQMSSQDGSAEGRQQDPENRLLWRMNRRRLDAESIRDALLAVAGTLDRRAGGPSLGPGTVVERAYRFEDTRRSVYTPVLRNRLLELFEVFDFADPNVCMGRRNVSTVATQALYLMNSPFVLEQARHAAGRVLTLAGLDEAGRVDRAYRLALGRLPSERERRLALAFLQPAQGQAEQRAAWEQLCQTLFACIDFRYVE
jgi:hypothetical protein